MGTVGVGVGVSGVHAETASNDKPETEPIRKVRRFIVISGSL
ncbi:MAG: hypothetical protein WED09_00065 [Homoserinimonas sp.]